MSGPFAEEPITYAFTGELPTPISEDEERQLFAQVVQHTAEPGSRDCPACGRIHPCPTQLQARAALRKAGVDLSQSLGTIWS